MWTVIECETMNNCDCKKNNGDDVLFRMRWRPLLSITCALPEVMNSHHGNMSLGKKKQGVMLQKWPKKTTKKKMSQRLTVILI